MYRCEVANLEAGMVLAKSIYTDSGGVLLRAGVELTESYIESLKRRGELAVHVMDGFADDIVVYEIVTQQLRASTAGHLGALFQSVAAVAGGQSSDRPASVQETVERLGDDELDLSRDGEEAFERLYVDIEHLLNEVLNASSAATLESLKRHSAYTFQHSVDVAILGILLGSRAKLSHAELIDLALGCLVHDIGKTYIDNAILEKPDVLSPEEFDEVKKHPYLGFELVRRLPVASILPAHVAYQHHERQDGAGYPRRLKGSNRVVRSSAEKLDPRRMLLIAEIAAVADVHSALASDRPYRAAMPLDETAKYLDRVAGTHLNRDVVDLFFRTVPTFPIGTWVEVRTGEHRRSRGVVIELDPVHLHRPHVRLHLDARGETLADPVELQLRDLPDVEIACLAANLEPMAAERVA